jgi:hypothetical protein
MPNDLDPQNVAELLQALDDVRDAAKRVAHERGMSAERGLEPAAGVRELRPPDSADDDPI